MLDIWPVWADYAGMIAYFFMAAVLLVILTRRAGRLAAKIMWGVMAGSSAIVGLMFLTVAIARTF